MAFVVVATAAVDFYTGRCSYCYCCCCDYISWNIFLLLNMRFFNCKHNMAFNVKRSIIRKVQIKICIIYNISLATKHIVYWPYACFRVFLANIFLKLAIWETQVLVCATDPSKYFKKVCEILALRYVWYKNMCFFLILFWTWTLKHFFFS